MHGQETIVVDAPIAEVWSLVSDVTRIGEFSPETFEAEWTGGSTGPAEGATFRGHVKRNGRGPTYWAPCWITTCREPDGGEAELAWAVGTGGRPVNNWGYRLREVDGGTEVTEFFRLESSLPLRAYWALAGRWRGRTNQRGMRATLEGMKAALEA